MRRSQQGHKREVGLNSPPWSGDKSVKSLIKTQVQICRVHIDKQSNLSQGELLFSPACALKSKNATRLLPLYCHAEVHERVVVEVTRNLSPRMISLIL